MTVNPGPVSSAVAPLSWLETAVAVLTAARRPMRARQIVEIADSLDFCPPSTSVTPWQSVNRDLHAAVRRGDQRIVLGPAPGQFRAAGVRADVAVPARGVPITRSETTDRFPVGPLADLVESRGGLRSCGVTHRPGDHADRVRWSERLHRCYLRSRDRGWVSVFDADELSVAALGLHPSQVWGNLWWESSEAELKRLDAKVREASAAAAATPTSWTTVADLVSQVLVASR